MGGLLSKCIRAAVVTTRSSGQYIDTWRRLEFILYIITQNDTLAYSKSREIESIVIHHLTGGGYMIYTTCPCHRRLNIHVRHQGFYKLDA